MSEIIYHTATVTQVKEGEVHVLISRSEACAACVNKSACAVTEGKPMIYVISVAQATQYQVGEQVRVGMRGSMGLRAVFYAYVLPLILMAIAFSVSLCVVSSELGQAFIVLVVLVVYYVVLSLFRQKFQSRFNYSIDKL